MPKPFWFDLALATPSEPGDVAVDGVEVHFETWGEVGRPGIALLHGSNAHLEWWRFVAPFLADQFRVVALDSSGNGDSGWRQRYSRELLAEEVWAVCEAAELGPRPVIAGHSFGGVIALHAAYRYGESLSGIQFIDFTVSPPSRFAEFDEQAEQEMSKAGRPTRVYADRSAALARFRYIPEQPVRHPEVRDYLAGKSLREVEGGWTWKFDPALFEHMEMGRDQLAEYAALQCRSSVILGAHSEDWIALSDDYMLEITGGHLPLFKIPGTYHHLMLDEPLALAMAMKAIALEWRREDAGPALRDALQEVRA